VGVDEVSRRAIFLDRDGVINRSIVGADGIPRPPASLGDLEILPGVPEACAELHGLGYLIIIATNQPDVARGTQARAVVEEIHDVLRQALPLDDIRVCYHDDADDCACRKPRAGLLHDAASEWNVDLAASYMIGDRWRDIEAGRTAGCVTILVRSGGNEQLLSEPAVKVDSLLQAARWIRDKPGIAREGRL
jgi:D-glycero-D-manno-heptose 1,7-bisphosphate phosphatase